MGRTMFKIGSVFAVCTLVVGIVLMRLIGIRSGGDIALWTRQEDAISVVTEGGRSLVDMLLQGDDVDYYYDEYDDFELEADYPFQYELETWINAIDAKLNSTLKNLQRDIDLRISSLMYHENVTVWQPFLEQWSRSQREQETLIQEYIHNIKCVGHWNNKANAMEYYNSEGTRIPQYITRPIMDTLINRSRVELSEFYHRGNVTLDITLPGKLVELIDSSLQVHIDMFEAWGESVITEWSERMAHNDFIVDKDSIPYTYWRRFLEAKHRVVAKHDELVEYQPSTKTWTAYTDHCHDVLHATFATHESQISALKDSADEQFHLRDTAERNTTPRVL